MDMRLSLKLDNAAFDKPGPELYRIFSELADRLQDAVPGLEDRGRIADANGNTVGTWSIQ